MGTKNKPHPAAKASSKSAAAVKAAPAAPQAPDNTSAAPPAPQNGQQTMSTATATAEQPKRGPGRPPVGTPRQTPEQKAANDQARRLKYQALPLRDKLLQRLDNANRIATAVLDDVKRAPIEGAAEACGGILESFVALYSALADQPDTMTLARRPAGERAPRAKRAANIFAGTVVTFREKYAEKWAARFGSDPLTVTDLDGDDYVVLTTLAGFVMAVPMAHVMASAPAA